MLLCFTISQTVAAVARSFSQFRTLKKLYDWARRAFNSMRTAMKVILIWGVALSSGLVLRQFLPHWKGLTLIRPTVGYFLPFNRVAFWACLLSAAGATILLLIREMTRDFGMR